MFKNIVVTVLVVMTLFCSNAFASFGDSELIRVIYERNTGTTEQLTDLGNINTILSTPVTTIAGNPLTANYPSNLIATYFAIDRINSQVWVSSTSDIPSSFYFNGNGYNSGVLYISQMLSYYNTLPADANGVVTGPLGVSSSFRVRVDANQGYLGGIVSTVNGSHRTTEISLASLVDGSASSVTQNLFFNSHGRSTSTLDEHGNTITIPAQTFGAIVATISTNADGSTTITTPTPIPAAAWLMGSGLIGMVGFRRRLAGIKVNCNISNA